MKVDAQIEKNCRWTISYLQGILAQSFSCKTLSNQKRTANTVRNTRRATLCRMWARLRTSIYQGYCVFVPLFSKPILTRQNIASTKISQGFLASQVSHLRRNKATNSGRVLLNINFSAALKNINRIGPP